MRNSMETDFFLQNKNSFVFLFCIRDKYFLINQSMQYNFENKIKFKQNNNNKTISNEKKEILILKFNFLNHNYQFHIIVLLAKLFKY